MVVGEKLIFLVVKRPVISFVLSRDVYRTVIPNTCILEQNVTQPSRILLYKTHQRTTYINLWVYLLFILIGGKDADVSKHAAEILVAANEIYDVL